MSNVSDIKTNRRGFIKGAAVGVGTLALSGSLVLGKDAAAAPVPKKWDKQTDVLVLGAGGAGLLAAIEAADAGSKAIILEREQVRASSTQISGGIVTLCQTEMQPGSCDELFSDLTKAHRNDNDPELVRAYVNNASSTYKRLIDSGVKFTQVSSWAGMSKPWGHNASSAAEMCNALEGSAKKKGVEMLLGTPARRLVVNPQGRVVGVEAESRGRKRYYGAKKAVVIATGGFTRNPELAKNFGRPGAEKIFPLTGVGSRGDGLIMGWGVGSNMTYMTDGVGPTAPADKETGKTIISFYGGSIIVNKNGKRFFRESEVYSDICWSGLQQPDTLMIQIYDSKIRKALEGTPLGDLMKGCKEYQGGSLKGLAEALNKTSGLDVSAMIDTVNRYNGYVDAGKDPEFDRQNLVGTSGKLVKIDTAPFYGVISTPGTTHYNGGLKINPQMQVLNVFGEKIPGLYAAGEVTGGFHGKGYVSGSAVGMAVIYGRIAGINAAKEKA